MGLINFKDIDFKQSIDTNNTVIDFNGSEIQIASYLSAQDTYDLIMVTVQKSKEKNGYNPFLIDLYFDLNIIYLYTNIVFNAEDRADEAGLYDILKTSGLIDAVKAKISDKDLRMYKGYIQMITRDNTTYSNTIRGAFEELFSKLPKIDNLQEVLESLKNNAPEIAKTLLTEENK